MATNEETRRMLEQTVRLQKKITELGGKIPMSQIWEDRVCYNNSLLEEVENLEAQVKWQHRNDANK